MTNKQRVGSFDKDPQIISIQPIESFKISDLIKVGTMFYYVNPAIIEMFPWETKKSIAMKLAKYELTAEDNDQEIQDNALSHGIYCTVTMAHVHDICKRHIKGGENLLNNDSLNLFRVIDKIGNRTIISVWREDFHEEKIWNMSVNYFNREHEHEPGSTFFFLSEPSEYVMH